MKAKLVSENMDFERTDGSKKQILDRVIGAASKKELMDELLEDEVWEQIERFVNDSILDRILDKHQRFDLEDLKEVTNKLVNEAFDTWAQTTEFEK